MYVMTCAGGYPLPAKAGKFEIYGFRATLNSIGSDSRVTLVDDENIQDGVGAGYIYTDSRTRKTTILDMVSNADTVGDIEVMFPEPIKTRRGISIAGWTNIACGTGMLYYR